MALVAGVAREVTACSQVVSGAEIRTLGAKQLPPSPEFADQVDRAFIAP